MRERSECRSELNFELETVGAAGTPKIVMGNDEELEGGAVKDGDVDDSRRLPAVAATCCCGSS